MKLNVRKSYANDVLVKVNCLLPLSKQATSFWVSGLL